MFAAVLVVCSLAATSCGLASTEAIYSTELECKEGAAQFVLSHHDQLRKAFGLYAVSMWCRQIEGKPS